MSDINEEMQDRLQELWDKYKFYVVTILLMVVSGVAGLSYQTIRSAQLREQAGSELFALIRASEENDLAAATESLSRIDGERFPHIYSLGLLAVAKVQGDDSELSNVELLESSIDKQDDEGLRLLTMLHLAENLIDDERYDDAVILLKENTPEDFPTMRMLFLERQGDAHLASGKASEAQDAYLAAQAIASETMRSHLPLLAIKVGAALSIPKEDSN